MAPKGGRGGGGRGGGSGAASCPGAFATTIEQVYFANDVVFLVVFLGIALALCSIRKKSGPGKKLIGIPYILAVLFTIIVYACSVIGTVLQECDVQDSRSVYQWNIAINVFFFLSYWLILFVLVYTLGAMLREQTGKFTTPFKIIYLVVMGFMAIITITIMGITSYNSWTLTNSGRYADTRALFEVATKFRVAFYVLYMLCVLGAGVLALITIVSLRSRRSPAGDLIGWVVALFVATLVWTVFNVATAALVLSNESFTFITGAVLLWLGSFFQALTYIFLLCIAKHLCWSRPSTVDHSNMAPNPYVPATHQQQQYAYNGQTNGQPYYYQAAPKHDAPELAR